MPVIVFPSDKIPGPYGGKTGRVVFRIIFGLQAEPVFFDFVGDIPSVDIPLLVEQLRFGNPQKSFQLYPLLVGR